MKLCEQVALCEQVGRHSLALWVSSSAPWRSTIGRRWTASVDQGETAQEGMQQWSVHASFVERTNVHVGVSKDNGTSWDYDRVGDGHVKTQPTVTMLFSQISAEISCYVFGTHWLNSDRSVGAS